MKWLGKGEDDGKMMERCGYGEKSSGCHVILIGQQLMTLTTATWCCWDMLAVAHSESIGGDCCTIPAQHMEVEGSQFCWNSCMFMLHPSPVMWVLVVLKCIKTD